MANHRVTPIDSERTFHAHELFFSRTDRKGIIQSGNDTFVRISGWSEDELIGAPHNIIRHPDMPRAAFQLVWDYLLAGKPVAAYVKNMARDGAYYWVLATIVPKGEGFLSVRLKPSGPLFDAVRPVYDRVRAVERELEESGTPVKEVIATSLPMLAGAVQEAGFADYDAFMATALATELELRNAACDPVAVPQACSALRAAGAHVDEMFRATDHLHDSHETLSTGLPALCSFAEDIRLGAINAQLAAVRLDDASSGLGVVADLMGVSARAVQERAGELTEDLVPFFATIDELLLRVSLARVQIDIARFFSAEVVDEAARGALPPHRLPDLSGLLKLLDAEIDGIAALQDRLRSHAGPVEQRLRLLGDQFDVLNSLDVAGRMEVARVTDAERIVTLFDRVRAQLKESTQRVKAMKRSATIEMSIESTDELRSDIDSALMQVGQVRPRSAA